MACARSFSQEFQKSYFFRVSDHVSQLLSSSPKDFGKKRLIVATLVKKEKAVRHNDAIYHSRRYISQMAILIVTIDAKYHNLTLNVTTLNVAKISLFFSKCPKF